MTYTPPNVSAVNLIINTSYVPPNVNNVDLIIDTGSVQLLEQISEILSVVDRDQVLTMIELLEQIIASGTRYGIANLKTKDVIQINDLEKSLVKRNIILAILFADVIKSFADALAKMKIQMIETQKKSVIGVSEEEVQMLDIQSQILISVYNELITNSDLSKGSLQIYAKELAIMIDLSKTIIEKILFDNVQFVDTSSGVLYHLLVQVINETISIMEILSNGQILSKQLGKLMISEYVLIKLIIDILEKIQSLENLANDLVLVNIDYAFVVDLMYSDIRMLDKDNIVLSDMQRYKIRVTISEMISLIYEVLKSVILCLFEFVKILEKRSNKIETYIFDSISFEELLRLLKIVVSLIYESKSLINEILKIMSEIINVEIVASKINNVKVIESRIYDAEIGLMSSVNDSMNLLSIIKEKE